MMSKIRFAAPLLALTLAACAGATSVSTTGRGPAYGADAKIKLARNDSGNNELKVQIDHLVPPQRIDQSYRRYAVWVDPMNEQPQLAGMLVYSSKDRTGKFETTTPFENFRLVVTAEHDEMPRGPRGEVVLSERIGG